MVLFNDWDFNEVERNRTEAPDGMVDVSDAVWAQEKFIGWLKSIISMPSDALPVVFYELLPVSEFSSQLPPWEDGSHCSETQVLIAASRCFIHVVSLIEHSSLEAMVSHVYEKLSQAGCGDEDLSEILIGVCEVFADDTPVAREKFFMKMLNRACDEQEWPTRHSTLRAINLIVVMLLVILFDGCDESSRLLVLLELDEIVEQIRTEVVLPYYLDESDDSA